MGLTVARCPSCGANLDLETDRDYFYCPHCGTKVIRQDNKIVIEHVERIVDEAAVKWVDHREKKRIDFAKRNAERIAENKRLARRGGIACLVFAVILVLVSFTKTFVPTVLIRIMAACIGLVGILVFSES